MSRTSLRRQLPLIFVFVLALPVFCWLRWTPGPWLADWVAAHGMEGSLAFAAVEKSFPSLIVRDAAIHLPFGDRLLCGAILLRPTPALPPGLYIHADCQGAVLQGSLAVTGDAMVCKGVDIQADLDRIAIAISKFAALGLKGRLHVTGEARLRRKDGLPLAGTINATWQGAKAGFLALRLPHEIQVQLTAKLAAGPQAAWQWRVSSTPPTLAGEGRLVGSSWLAGDWEIQGGLHIGGNDGRTIHLSGALAPLRLE